jgi:hypothetical protein
MHKRPGPRPGGRRVEFCPARAYHRSIDERETMTLSDDDIAHTRMTLHELQVEHRDLDQVICHLTEHAPLDELLVRRLKKRKLHLKDKIDCLEKLLVPDVPA